MCTRLCVCFILNVYGYTSFQICKTICMPGSLDCKYMCNIYFTFPEVTIAWAIVVTISPYSFHMHITFQTKIKKCRYRLQESPAVFLANVISKSLGAWSLNENFPFTVIYKKLNFAYAHITGEGLELTIFPDRNIAYYKSGNMITAVMWKTDIHLSCILSCQELYIFNKSNIYEGFA